MGRIRTVFVKRAAERILREHPDKFTDKFEENKKILIQVAEIPTKKLRNMIAGYITKKIKTKS